MYQVSQKKLIGGYTLIELMVALAMSIFLVGGVILMYASARATFTDANQLSRMQENIRFASDYLVRDIRNAGFRDEFTLTVGQSNLIRDSMVTINDSGSEVTVRYAGRGHCQQEFEEYRVVQNTYFLDQVSGELRCRGRAVPPADNDPTGSMALVAGLTGLSFSVVMADGWDNATDSSITCQDDPVLEPENRCLGIRIGLEFEGMRSLTDPGQLEPRFVELFAAFRNTAIEYMYRNLN